jgi:hypothetical protein
MLHAPDFLGYDSAIAGARDRPDLVAQELELKKVGNSSVFHAKWRRTSGRQARGLAEDAGGRRSFRTTPAREPGKPRKT